MDLECYSQAPLYVNLNQQHLEISTSMSSPSFTSLLCSEGQMRAFSIFSLLCFLTALTGSRTQQGILSAHSSAPHLLQGREKSSFKINLLHGLSLINQIFIFYCFLSNPSSIKAQEKLTQCVRNISSPFLLTQNANKATHSPPF